MDRLIRKTNLPSGEKAKISSDSEKTDIETFWERKPTLFESV